MRVSSYGTLRVDNSSLHSESTDTAPMTKQRKDGVEHTAIYFKRYTRVELNCTERATILRFCVTMTKKNIF